MGDPPWAVEIRGMGAGVHVGGLLAILGWPGAGPVAVPILSVRQGHVRVWTRLWPGTCCCGSPLEHKHVGTRDTPGFWWGDARGVGRRPTVCGTECDPVLELMCRDWGPRAQGGWHWARRSRFYPLTRRRWVLLSPFYSEELEAPGS